jgi:ankyrin repeat protein
MKCAIETNDKETIGCLLKEASEIVEYNNPLLLVLLVDYVPVIHTVIRSIVQVSGVTNEKLARILVEAGCPLTQVVSVCNVDVVERMIEMGADLNYREKQTGLAALHMAARAGDLQLAELLLHRGAEVNVRCQRGETPLHKAVNAGNFHVAERLLGQAADVDARDNSHLAPLHCAFHSHLQRDYIIWLLVHNRANILARDEFGVTPFHLAFDFPEIVEYGLSRGIDANVTEFCKGRTPLHFIMERINYDTLDRQIESIKALLRHGADVNRRDSDGCTPLHRAFETINFSFADNVFPIERILRLCLEHGADVNARNSKCETILGVAADGHRACVETILEYMAKLELRGSRVDDCNFRIVRSLPRYKDYYRTCKAELLASRERICYGNVSFFNLLTGSPKKMSDYARNHDLVESFLNSSYYKRFPIYCTHLSFRVNEAVERQKLMYNAAKFLSGTLLFISPYDVIMDNILSYLSEADMRRFLIQ